MRRAGFILAILALASPAHSEGDAVPEPATVSYVRDIKPIFDAGCARCHNGKTRQGGLDMSTPATMLKGGVSGPAYVAGDAQKSLMVELMEFKEMPPRREEPRPTDEQLKKIRAWIDAGAPEK